MNFSLRLIVVLMFLISSQSGFSQIIEDDFEGDGTITSWYGDACTINTSFQNPVQEGINTSLTVLKYDDQGGQYANARFDVDNNFDLSSSAVFSLKIYVPSSGLTGTQTNQISLKLQDGTLGEPWTTQSEVIKSIETDQWQTVTFDFENDNYVNLDGGSPAPISRADFNRVILQVNGENNNDKVIAYIDDFYYEGTVELDPVYDQLVWSDEFDTDGAVNSNKWFHQTQLPAGGSWYNNEQQHYTDRIENTYVENGILKIVAKKETYTNQGYTKQYTSARLNSKYAFTYGKVEVKAKLPSGVGTWPAIWTLGKNINEDGAYWDIEGYGTTNWPACGEIDIMEHWGTNQNFVQSATHTPSSYGATVNHGGQTISTVSSEFHIYTLEWSPEKLKFSVDNTTHFIYKPSVQDENTWPYVADQYLLLNIAIASDIDPNFTESAMEIDYVRVYQEGNSTGIKGFNSDVKVFSLFPNPANDVLHINFTEEDYNGKAEIKLFSIDGKIIRSFSTNSLENELDMIGLDSGVYFVKVSANNKSYSEKIIKQ